MYSGFLSVGPRIASMMSMKPIGLNARVPSIAAVIPSAYTPFPPALVQAPVSVSYGGGKQRGGNMPVYVDGLASQYKESGKVGYKLVSKIFDRIKEELRGRRKQLSQNSENNIKKLLTQFQQVEDNVVKSLIQLERYIFFTDVFRDYRENKELDTDDIDRLLKEHAALEEKFKSTQLKVFNVLSGLFKVTSDCGGDPVINAYSSSFKSGQIPEVSPYNAPGNKPTKRYV